jgi:hypothetical protein
MATEVDISNLALAYIGDASGISSINPPDGSAQAEHCQRFYPIARDSMLNLHRWSFASRRVLLAEVTNEWTNWMYAYGYPQDCMTAVAIMPSDAEDDYSTRFVPTDTPYYGLNYSPVIAAGQYVPQVFSVETNTLGNRVIYANQENAILRYQGYVTDAGKFPPLFTMALSWHLASMLAGVIIKGEQGAATAKRCIDAMGGYLQQARAQDGSERQITPAHIVPWQSGR